MDHDLNLFMEDHINGGYGLVLDQLAADECDYFDDLPLDDLDEPTDEILAQQELEDFEQADEYFGGWDFGGEG